MPVVTTLSDKGLSLYDAQMARPVGKVEVIDLDKKARGDIEVVQLNCTVQGSGFLKKSHRQLPVMSAGSRRLRPHEPLPFHQRRTWVLPRAAALPRAWGRSAARICRWRTARGPIGAPSRKGHRARRGLARGGHHAGKIGHHGLAAGLFCPTAYPKPIRPLRPGSYPVGRAVLRQHPSRKPLVPPQNGGARTARVVRFCRLSRRASEHRRLF